MGDLTEERLNDAHRRILGLKAHLHLCEEGVRIPDRGTLEAVDCEEHQRYTAQAARYLHYPGEGYQPLFTNKTGREETGVSCLCAEYANDQGVSGDPAKQLVIEELERAGFEVDVCPNYHDLEVEHGVNPMNFVKMLGHSSRAGFTASHDFALVVLNIKGYAQENEVRVRWSCNHSCELPWYNEEIPTIGISLNYTNHLIDVPQLHAFINAYGPNRIHIRAAIEKMTGLSEFKGKAEDTVFCGRWEAGYKECNNDYFS